MTSRYIIQEHIDRLGFTPVGTDVSFSCASCGREIVSNLIYDDSSGNYYCVDTYECNEIAAENAVITAMRGIQL